MDNLLHGRVAMTVCWPGRGRATAAFALGALFVGLASAAGCGDSGGIRATTPGSGGVQSGLGGAGSSGHVSGAGASGAGGGLGTGGIGAGGTITTIGPGGSQAPGGQTAGRGAGGVGSGGVGGPAGGAGGTPVPTSDGSATDAPLPTSDSARAGSDGATSTTAGQGGRGAGGTGAGGQASGGTKATGGSGSGGLATGGIRGTGGQGTGGSATGGSSTSTDAGTSSGSSLATVIAAYCATARTCCAKAAISTAGLVDCETQAPTHVGSMQLLNMGEVALDSAALAACEAAYKQAATTCTADQVIALCPKIFVGVQGEGQPCGQGGNPGVMGVPACKSTGGPEICQYTGDSTDPTMTGTCHAMVHGKVGDHCIGSCPSGQDCSTNEYTLPSDVSVTECFESDGLYCSSLAATPYTCVPLVGLGKSCAADSQACGTLNYCDPGTTTCHAAATVGQSCATTSCLPSLTCGADNKCAPWSSPFADTDFTCKSYPPGLI